MYRFSDSKGETYAGRWLSLNRFVAAVVLLQLRDRQTDRQTDTGSMLYAFRCGRDQRYKLQLHKV